ncbi:hypothetical protein [Elizabethkingia occulta]|uniref:hypothetical protein n=1 Tax=Elizabethkingia occulta TaxID=1867263 RepID=UPI00099AE798|nr:hypothetical protein [Elizabethkingia occulta]OPB95394.1 hypothetical protein BB020_17520 [Elizabethkingia occulta]
MEQLFSEEQLLEIQTKAKNEFEEYHNTYVIDGNTTETSIKIISELKHLIFVEGNEDTGFKHFNNRHGYFSYKNYWRISDKKEYKLDDPSKFRSQMIPIIDYLKIADEIFSEENKNITKNNRPDLFDKYTGSYSYHNNESEKYHLLTYKDTKIVHTFFPDKKKHNPKQKCKFGKEVVTSSLKLPEGFRDLLLPYENEKGIIAFSFLIRKYYLEKKERYIIQRHDEEGKVKEQYVFGERDFEENEVFDREDMMSLQHGDVTQIEQLINELANNSENIL